MNVKNKMWGKLYPLLFQVFSFVILYSLSVVTVTEGGAAPNTITIPILKSIMGGPLSTSAEKLKELVKSHPAINQSPKEVQNIISKLNSKPGTIDPVMHDMLQAFERTHRDTKAVLAGASEELLHFPDDTASNRVATSTEETGIIWHEAMSRPQSRQGDFNRFSSRYRSNQTGSNFNDYANYDTENNQYNDRQNSYHHNHTQGHANNTDHHHIQHGHDHHDPHPHIPFNHVTDPNLRNHRLYAWEFETYKNFTHIDQPEDLMADEDIATETKISPVAVAPPPSNPPNNQLQQHPPNSHPPPHIIHATSVSSANKTEKSKDDPNDHLWQPKPPSTKSKRVKVKGIPHIVISLEDTSETNQFPGYNFQMDSAEHSGQRPREPLRQSSTENIVYVHGGSGEERGRYPFDLDDGENDQFTRRFPSLSYRPPFNPNEPSDALFIDPDQEFFTSTVRADQEISSETMPKRRRKKLKKLVRKDEIDEVTRASNKHFSNRMGERFLDTEESQPEVHYSPVYSKNNVQGAIEDRARAHSLYGPTGNVYRTPGPHFPMMRPTPKYFGMSGGDRSSRYKQDRILNTEGESTSDSNNNGKGTGNGGDEAASPSNFETFDEATLSHLSDGGHIGNYYSLRPSNDGESNIGLHSNLGLTGADHSLGSKNHPFSNNHEAASSQEYLGGGHKSRLQNVIGALLPFTGQQATKKLSVNPTDQIIAPGNLEDFYHPYAEADHQVNQYPDESTIAVSWSNTWYLVGAIIFFTAMMVLLLPSLVAPGRMGKKDTRHDLDEDDFNTSNYQGSNSNYPNNNYHYDNANNDVNQNSDLWSEIKGVYSDLVNMFRGEYTLLNKINKNKQPDGPKIVYRDEDGEESDESDQEEDDEKERLTLRNRKREQYLKKQRQMLKKQQQQHNKLKHQQQQQQHNQNQAKSNGLTKKTLVSKAKVSTGGSRDNKDSSAKTIEATSVNNLVVVSGPGPSIPMARTATAEKEAPVKAKEEKQKQEQSSPRSAAGFVFPENTTMATMPFINTTGYGNVYGTDGISPFLREWAQVQLINNNN